MNGIVVVDKPAGWTSAHVVAKVKRTLKATKVGHTGTLDPFATGVLICCVDKATRLARLLSQGRKAYEAVMRLGVRTDTQDLTGHVVSKGSTLDITEKQIKTVFEQFLKVEEQVPPAFSALKHQGKPLYTLARKGVFVEKPARPIVIYHLEIRDIDLPFIRFDVVCSAGTYIRTLSADLGDALGCGAHLVSLCRTETGGFTLAETISVATLERLAASGQASSCILPMHEALKGIPEIRAGQHLAQKIRYGKPLTESEIGPVAASNASWIKVTDADRDLIAILELNKKDGILPYMCVFPKVREQGT
jgi:tRNA pseudouridine55 synthase